MVDMEPVALGVLVASKGEPWVFRWAVTATFVTGPHAEPICVEYRTRQVNGPKPTYQDGEPVVRRMLAQSEGWGPMDEVSPRGMPRYVFERAAQQRLADMVRHTANPRPGDSDAPSVIVGDPDEATPEVVWVGITGFPDPAFDANTDAVFPEAPVQKTGRPPARPLVERLRLLAAVEEAFEKGRTLADVAADHHVARTTVRDLLSWARRDAEPQLFEAVTPGRRGGRLTPAGRAMLERLNEQEG